MRKAFIVLFLILSVSGWLACNKGNEANQAEAQPTQVDAEAVAQAMTPDPVYVEPDMSIQVVAGLMVDNGYHTIPVLQEGRLVGIVGKDDILNTLVTNNAMG